ncbi:DUF1045 domain-containing protein [Dyella jejuensis]|uniref:DUF1045 domain-containing protein n=1 Tax=Dyella jejuensis TaxID=1432009 RepID=A0ABW8JEG0_9GAMM
MRYAVYYCPAADSELAAFGREWLATACIPGIAPGRFNSLLAAVRRYGWHATIVAPGALVDGVGYDAFRQRVVDIAHQSAPFLLSLRLKRLAGFLALRPSTDTGSMSALAERCVRSLAPLRAPLDASAWQRRATGLDEVELALFRQFGYPYVLDRYRFHMTLSAPADSIEEQALREWLSPRLASLHGAHIDALTLCREREPGAAFEPVERVPLGRTT